MPRPKAPKYVISLKLITFHMILTIIGMQRSEIHL